MRNGKVYAYPLPYREALENGEESAYWESYRRNIECAGAVKDAIDKNYDGCSLKAGCANKVISRFGSDRLDFVLAYNIRQLSYDGRISRENKTWAQGVPIPQEDDASRQLGYSIPVHAGLLNLFTSMARREQEQGFFPEEQCCGLDGRNYGNRLLVLKKELVQGRHPAADWQLFYCMEDNSSVFGKFLKDGSTAFFERADFYGELAAGHVPGWAKEWLEEFAPEPEQRREMGMKMDF